MDIKGNILTIEVNLSDTFGDSKSGKTEVIGSTMGTVALTGLGKPNIIVGLNVNKRKK